MNGLRFLMAISSNEIMSWKVELIQKMEENIVGLTPDGSSPMLLSMEIIDFLIAMGDNSIVSWRDELQRMAKLKIEMSIACEINNINPSSGKAIDRCTNAMQFLYTISDIQLQSINKKMRRNAAMKRQEAKNLMM